MSKPLSAKQIAHLDRNHERHVERMNRAFQNELANYQDMLVRENSARILRQAIKEHREVVHQEHLAAVKQDAVARKQQRRTPDNDNMQVANAA